MPRVGYKKKFKNIIGLKDELFTIFFDLEYEDNGVLKIKNEKNKYFDSGDFNILLDNVFDSFTEDKFKEYDNGIYILSVCKYIVDNIPNLYSISDECQDMIDIYYKQEIIDDYNIIKANK